MIDWLLGRETQFLKGIVPAGLTMLWWISYTHEYMGGTNGLIGLFIEGER